MTTAELRARRDRVLGAGAPLFYRDPITIVRGDGVWLFDADGRRYVDMYNNVPCVGHCHPHVVEAMRQQASTLNVHSRYLHEGVLDYAERLTDLHADPLTSVVLACTGTEANEVAMAMARVATGGRGFICTDSAYHGNSAEVSRLTDATEATDEIRPIPVPQRYRPLRGGLSSSELAELYLSEVRSAIDGFEQAEIPLAGMLVCLSSLTRVCRRFQMALCRELPKWFEMLAVYLLPTKYRLGSAEPAGGGVMRRCGSFPTSSR